MDIRTNSGIDLIPFFNNTDNGNNQCNQKQCTQDSHDDDKHADGALLRIRDRCLDGVAW